MTSSVSENHVAQADESSHSISLHSTCFVPLTTSVSISTACENKKRDVDGEADAHESDLSQSGTDSAEERIPGNTIEHTLENFGNRCTVNTKPIRPLYKYIKNKKCLLCGFESKAKDLRSVRTHLFVHVTDKEFECDTCDKKFRSLSHLMNHRLIHKNVFPFSCDLCDKKYRNRTALRNHKEKKHGKKQKFKCEFCDKVLSTNFVLKEHLRIHTGERPFLCGFCKRSFRLKYLLTKHLRCHDEADKTHIFQEYNTSSHDSASSSPIVPPTSKTKIDHAEPSSPSVSLASADSTCLMPLTDTVSMSSASESNCDDGGGVSAQICEEQESGADSARDRISESGLRIDAFDTSESFDSKCSIKIKLIRPLYKYVKNNKCLLCGFESKAKDHFSIKNHLFVHVTKKVFKCDTCSKKFRTLQCLTNHRLIHKDVFPFSCDLCDKKYQVRASLANHKKKTHGERRKFKCEFCNKVLSTNVTLKEHLRIHTGERPFVCAVCKQSFRLKCLLAKHRRHCSVNSAEDKRVYLEQYLMNHRLIHNDVFKFACDLCDKKYQTEMCLRNHKRREHEG